MDPLGNAVLAASFTILAIGVVFGAYYLNTSAVIVGQQQTISDLQSTVNSLASHPVTSTTTRVTTETVNKNIVTTTTRVVTQTFTGLPNVPWTSAMFIRVPNANCSPVCFSPGLNDALLFDCPNAAAKGSCAVTVYDSATKTNYSIVAANPEFNAPNELAVDNCGWDAYILPNNQQLGGGHGFGYCVPIGPNAFVVAEEMPPPP